MLNNIQRCPVGVWRWLLWWLFHLPDSQGVHLFTLCYCFIIRVVCFSVLLVSFHFWCSAVLRYRVTIKPRIMHLVGYLCAGFSWSSPKKRKFSLFQLFRRLPQNNRKYNARYCDRKNNCQLPTNTTKPRDPRKARDAEELYERARWWSGGRGHKGHRTKFTLGNGAHAVLVICMKIYRVLSLHFTSTTL